MKIFPPDFTDRFHHFTDKLANFKYYNFTFGLNKGDLNIIHLKI